MLAPLTAIAHHGQLAGTDCFDGIPSELGPFGHWVNRAIDGNEPTIVVPCAVHAHAVHREEARSIVGACFDYPALSCWRVSGPGLRLALRA